MTNLLPGVLTGGLFNYLCAVALHSSVNEHPRRDFLGFAVVPCHKLDFHHFSPRFSTLVGSLAKLSCSNDDARHLQVFLCSNCMRTKIKVGAWGRHFKGMDMESDKLTLTWSAMFCSTSDIKWCTFLNYLVTFVHSRLFYHIGFNQSKPILLPSNIAATTHRKHCYTSSNNIKSFFLNVSTKY